MTEKVAMVGERPREEGGSGRSGGQIDGRGGRMHTDQVSGI